jgi:hypothetical protein
VAGAMGSVRSSVEQMSLILRCQWHFRVENIIYIDNLILSQTGDPDNELNSKEDFGWLPCLGSNLKLNCSIAYN